MYVVNIAAFSGEMGEFSVRPGYTPGAEQMYPTHPVLNHESKPQAWVRHIDPIIGILPKIISGELYGPYEPGSFAEKALDQTFKKRVLDPLKKGEKHDFPDRLTLLEGYGMRIAPRWDVISAVNGIPSLIRVTPHIEGTPLDDWLNNEAVPLNTKETESRRHVTILSAYARDLAVARMEGKSKEETPLYFDLSRTDQYLVTPEDEITLIDTGDESVRMEENIEGQLFMFHRLLAASGVRNYLDDETRQIVTNDLDAIRAAFQKANIKSDVVDAIEMEHRHPGYYLD